MCGFAEMHGLFQPPYPAEASTFRKDMRVDRATQPACAELRWHPMARLLTFAVSGTLAWATVILFVSLIVG